MLDYKFLMFVGYFHYRRSINMRNKTTNDMVIKQDCKGCGRRNVEGRLYQDSSDNALTAFESVCGTVGGFCLGGPIGAAVGGTLAHKATKWVIKKCNSNDDGKVRYRFTCPACGHEWFDWVNE